MSPVLNGLILLLSILALWGGAVVLVECAARVAKKLGLSELTIGLTVIAFGTSSPEFAVTVGAALKGQSDISIGNIVGSNIFNLGIILGLVALIRPVRTTRLLVKRDGLLLLGATILLIVFFWNHGLDRWEGIVLMAVLGGYLVWLFVRGEAPEEEIPLGEFRWYHVPFLFLGLATVVLGGHFLVVSAVGLATALGVSEWLIALTIVGAGTSAPELATSLVAVIRGRHGISAGNLIGSDLFNILGVLGLAAVLHPLTLHPKAMFTLVLMAANVGIVVVLMRTGRKISRREGVILIVIGIARWVIEGLR